MDNVYLLYLRVHSRISTPLSLTGHQIYFTMGNSHFFNGSNEHWVYLGRLYLHA